MIRINLVPQKRNRRELAVRNEMAVVGLGVAVLVIVLGLFHGVAMARASSIATTNARLQQEIDQKKEILKEIEATEIAKKDLEQRLRVIKQLKASKSGPVRMLDELAMATPDKLLLSSLKEDQGLVKLTGLAISNEVISQFLSNLERSDYFTDVYLNAIDQTEKDDQKLKSFSLTARLVLTGKYASAEPEPEATP